MQNQKNEVNSPIEQLNSDYLLQLVKLYREEITKLEEVNRAQKVEIEHLKELNEVYRTLILVYESQTKIGASLIEKFAPSRISDLKNAQ